MQTHDTPQVWIGCLASYNAGRLIGEWVDATDADEIGEAEKRVAITAVAAAQEAGEYPVYFGDPEEFFIADYDGFPQAAVSMLGEYADYATVAAVAVGIEAHGEPFAKWLGSIDSLDEPATLVDRFTEAYRGEYDSEEAYAREYVSDTGGWSGVPSQVEIEVGFQRKKIDIFDELDSYIDWESVARELFDHGSLTFDDGSVFDDSQ